MFFLLLEEPRKLEASFFFLGGLGGYFFLVEAIFCLGLFGEKVVKSSQSLLKKPWQRSLKNVGTKFPDVCFLKERDHDS